MVTLGNITTLKNNNYNNGYNSGRTQGQNDVKNSPNNYGLYTLSQYNDNYNSGRTQGQNDIKNNPGDYGLKRYLREENDKNGKVVLGFRPKFLFIGFYYNSTTVNTLYDCDHILIYIESMSTTHMLHFRRENYNKAWTEKLGTKTDFYSGRYGYIQSINDDGFTFTKAGCYSLRVAIG